MAVARGCDVNVVQAPLAETAAGCHPAYEYAALRQMCHAPDFGLPGRMEYFCPAGGVSHVCGVHFRGIQPHPV